MKLFFGIILCLPIIALLLVQLIIGINWGIDVTDRLKRAAVANTIELATQELQAVISYLEKEGITLGYTSVLYNTPDEDVGYWYQNLKGSLEELQKVSSQTTQLERTNILMKLRETILDDEAEGTKVTQPVGTLLLLIIGVVLIVWWVADR